MSNIYLERYAYPKTYISTEDYAQPDLIIVLPCYNEPDLLHSLDAIDTCDKPVGQVSIIVVINASIVAEEEIKKQANDGSCN